MAEAELMKVFIDYTSAMGAIILSSVVVLLALVGFAKVMTYVDKNNTLLVYARKNIFISLAGASALYVILVALMTWVILRFMDEFH